jgi:hypothetical protein
MVLLIFAQINPDVLFTYLYQLEAYRKSTKLDFIPCVTEIVPYFG